MFQEEKIIKLETVRNDVVTIFKLRLAQREKGNLKKRLACEQALIVSTVGRTFLCPLADLRRVEEKFVEHL